MCYIWKYFFRFLGQTPELCITRIIQGLQEELEEYRVFLASLWYKLSTYKLISIYFSEWGCYDYNVARQGSNPNYRICYGDGIFDQVCPNLKGLEFLDLEELVYLAE